MGSQGALSFADDVQKSSGVGHGGSLRFAVGKYEMRNQTENKAGCDPLLGDPVSAASEGRPRADTRAVSQSHPRVLRCFLGRGIDMPCFSV